MHPWRRWARCGVLLVLAGWAWAGQARPPASTPPVAVRPGSGAGAPLTHRDWVSLKRTSCLGSCPAYTVTVHGDGAVLFTRPAGYDAGTHAYRVPRKEAAALLRRIGRDGLWGLRANYDSGAVDAPSQILTFHVGGRDKRIVDVVGASVGMPATVTAFGEAVDRVARTRSWLHFDGQTLHWLEAEKFDFRSPAAGQWLAYAVMDPMVSDNTALLALLKRGGRRMLEAANRSAILRRDWTGEPRTLLYFALLYRRVPLVEPLLAMGDLALHGKPDQARIDAAFGAAIGGGDLALVRRMWRVRGTRAHPSLAYVRKTYGVGGKITGQTLPVTFRLTFPEHRRADWQGQAIAAWLAARGCDLKATDNYGESLMHIAALAGYARFVGFLAARGVPVNVPNRAGDLPTDLARNQDTVLALLKAGALARPRDARHLSLREQAQDNHWTRVLAWLDAHPRDR